MHANSGSLSSRDRDSVNKKPVKTVNSALKVY